MRNKFTAILISAAVALGMTACDSSENPHENNADDFRYRYDSKLGGMVVTDYLEASPKVVIPNSIEGEPVVKVDLSGCVKELTELEFPDSVKSFALSRQIKESLQNVNIPSSVTNIENGQFSGCTKLTSITIPNGVTTICSGAFRYCYNLKSITIPESITAIGGGAYGGAFEQTGLTNITIPDSVTDIGRGAFEDTPWLFNQRSKSPLVIINNILIDGQTCSGDVTIPDNVTSIGNGAFFNCENITSITIPNSTTSIGNLAFRGCTKLTNITIPDSVTHIGNSYQSTHYSYEKEDCGAFADCDNIIVTYKGKTYDYVHINDLYTAING